MNGRSPIVAAVETRRELGLGESEPIDIFKVLRYVEHIIVVRCPFGGTSRMSGLFVRRGDIKLTIINTGRSLGHQIFTAAHEFYHIKYSEGMSGSLCQTGTFSERSVEEFNADKFAANLLVPQSGLEYLIEKEFGRTKLSLPEIIHLEQYFAVSHRVMLRRLKEVGRLTDQEAAQLADVRIRSVAREFGYSTRLYEKTSDYEVMSDLPHKVREALERQLISEGKAREFLLTFGYEDWEEGGTEEEDVDE
ncbi:MAG TPA: ImmA/IrrE family metallo-endopeptidase [Firmicutes bacterium]|nr:ImmA/IrrE family metallo-endopeptidase [Bacillota bacterium]